MTGIEHTMSSVTYPLYTVLKVHIVDDIEYTATITQDGVWQIKGKRGKQDIFPTVEEWIASLPGSPSINEIKATYVLAEQEERREQNQKKKAKKEKWDVPTRRHPIKSLPYAYYLYSLIKECDKTHKTGLLLREDIRKAYNHFVAVLITLGTKLSTYIPYKTNYYKELNVKSFTYNTNILQSRRIEQAGWGEYHNLEAAYKSLLDLFQDNLIPWMAQKYDDLVDEMDLKETRQHRDMCIKQIERLTEIYNAKIAHLHTKVARYQGTIDKIQNKKLNQQ